jgi:hypothetical protein
MYQVELSKGWDEIQASYKITVAKETPLYNTKDQETRTKIHTVHQATSFEQVASNKFIEQKIENSVHHLQTLVPESLFTT